MHAGIERAHVEFAVVWDGHMNLQSYAFRRRLNVVQGGRGIRNYLCG